MPTPTPAPLEQITPDIAAGLGEGWSAAPSTRYYDNARDVWYLHHADGIAVRLRLDERTDGRLLISGELPDAPDGLSVNTDDLKRGSATADPARPVRGIAAQIRRTVLPVLDASNATLRQRIDAARGMEDGKAALRKRLSAIPGLGNGLSWAGEPRGTWKYAALPSASVSVNHDRDGAYASIELRGLTADQAERVLRALTTPHTDPAPHENTPAEPNSVDRVASPRGIPGTWCDGFDSNGDRCGLSLHHEGRCLH